MILALAVVTAFSLGVLMNAALWAVCSRLDKQGELDASHARQTADNAELTAGLLLRLEGSVRRLEERMEAQSKDLEVLRARFEVFADGPLSVRHPPLSGVYPDP